MTDFLALRLRVLLGTIVDLGEEEAATGGRRVFRARGRQETEGGPPTRRLILHPPSPDGPSAVALHHRADLLLVLTHPAIAAPLATGEFEGRGWVVEPLPNGIPLASRLASRGTLPLRETITILRDVARALEAIHRRGMVHGELTAAAVFLDPRGTVLSGFGLVTGGTVAEDLRALGQLGWEMLCGSYTEESAKRSLQSHRPSASCELADLVEGLLGKGGRPVKPARASEVLGRLDKFPSLTPPAIAEFLDGIGGGGRRTRRGTGWLADAAGVMGGALGRLRSGRAVAGLLFCLLGPPIIF